MPVLAGATSNEATLRTRRENENPRPTLRRFEFCRRSLLGSRRTHPCGFRFNCGLVWFNVDSGFHVPPTTPPDVGRGGGVFFSNPHIGLPRSQWSKDRPRLQKPQHKLRDRRSTLASSSGHWQAGTPMTCSVTVFYSSHNMEAPASK
ncbi:hypothetical protein MTO96_018111 [Rhipicephalus appendiculatus]